MTTGICEWQECGKPFETRRVNGLTARRFCSGACRQKHNNMLAAERALEPEPSPDKWDGKTVYSDRPLRRDYYLTCMMCARQVPLKLSDSDARNIPQQRCAGCGGKVMLELDTGRATLRSTRITVRGRPAVLSTLMESAL